MHFLPPVEMLQEGYTRWTMCWRDGGLYACLLCRENTKGVNNASVYSIVMDLALAITLLLLMLFQTSLMDREAIGAPSGQTLIKNKIIKSPRQGLHCTFFLLSLL